MDSLNSFRFRLKSKVFDWICKTSISSLPSWHCLNCHKRTGVRFSGKAERTVGLELPPRVLFDLFDRVEQIAGGSMPQVPDSSNIASSCFQYDCRSE